MLKPSSHCLHTHTNYAPTGDSSKGANKPGFYPLRAYWSSENGASPRCLAFLVIRVKRKWCARRLHPTTPRNSLPHVNMPTNLFPAIPMGYLSKFILQKNVYKSPTKLTSMSLLTPLTHAGFRCTIGTGSYIQVECRSLSHIFNFSLHSGVHHVKI